MAIVLVGWLIVCVVTASLIAPKTPNVGFADAASVLAFISLVAVSIERGIEGFFAVMAGPFGQWWPLRVVRDEFDTFEEQTNKLLTDVVGKTLEGLAAAKTAAGDNVEAVKAIQKAIDDVVAEQARLGGQFEDVKTKLAKGSSRLARVSEINTGIAATLQSAQTTAATFTSEAQVALRTASDLADRASLIISSFQDNPARRLASLAIGAGLGMLVAGGAGLNVFVATLGTGAPEGSIAAFLAGTIGIVVTGIVVGLGSAPTHELVRTLQTYKETRTPKAAVGSLEGASAAAAGEIQEAFGPGGTAVVAGRPMRLRVRDVRQTG